MRIELEGISRLKGEIYPPPDKSISHRAIIFSCISRGRSVIRNFLRAGDTLSTLGAFRAMGAEISDAGDVIVEGKGLDGLKEPHSVIDCGNSGTTMRLLSGVLSGNPFFSVLTGDESLRKRPMGRVIAPLRQMGAEIMARGGDSYPPMAIRGGRLKAISYEMPVASAQVKSAILLAGLYANGVTEVKEPVRSRDHTERMLPHYGAKVEVEGLSVRIHGGTELRGIEAFVPGDFSSAAFFIAAALIASDADVTVRAVGVNPTRTGFMDVIREMGAEVEVVDARMVAGEPVADIRARASELRGVDIGGERIPSLIDEFPVLCVLATQAEGMTTIRGAGELRVKESDRIRAMAEGLKSMGAQVEELEDGLSIRGKVRLRGAEIDSHGDHRISMAFSIAALSAEGKTVIHGAETADISYPGFFYTLRRLAG